MTTEKQIIQILESNEFGATLKEGDYIRGIYKEHFARVAREIFKTIEAGMDNAYDKGYSDGAQAAASDILD
jgi:hypothetical protein